MKKHTPPKAHLYSRLAWIPMGSRRPGMLQEPFDDAMRF